MKESCVILEKNKMSYENAPKNLDECFVELNNILEDKEIAFIKNLEEKPKLHRGLGMKLRNEWGLWGGSRLSKWFKEKGIRHPDDMSGIILTSFWEHINDEPIDLEEQIKYYQDYWEKRRKTTLK